MKPRAHGLGQMPRYGNGWMHQFGHVYALQHELLSPNRSNWFRAMETWHTAREENLALNNVHYTHILRQCVPPAQWEASLSVLRQMRREAIRPDVVGVGCTLAACCDAEKYDEALHVFDHFQEKVKLQMDSVCFLAALKASSKSANWNKALAICALQKEEGIPAQCDVHAALVVEAVEKAEDRGLASSVAASGLLETSAFAEEEGELLVVPAAKPAARKNSARRVVAHQMKRFPSEGF